MNEKKYKRRLEFQEKMISRQSGEIKSLKDKIEELEFECKEKDELIHSVDSLREELSTINLELKEKKNEYDRLIKEVRKMKEVINNTCFKGRWKLIRWLIK